MNFASLSQFRRSHRSYVPGKSADRAKLEELLAIAALAPSSYNQQGWQVVVVGSQAEREKLFREACPQNQVLDASAVLIVCGNLEQYKNLPEIVQKTTSMDDATRNFIIEDAAKSYGGNPAFARDEAIRSASLFAMAFMFAAADGGFGTGPMIGFDSEKLCRAFNIRQPLFPVMLISFGHVKDEPFPRGYRRAVKDFAKFV